MTDDIRNKTLKITYVHLIIIVLMYLVSLYLVYAFSKSGIDYKERLKESKTKIERLEMINKRSQLKIDSISKAYEARKDTIRIIDTMIVYREKRIKQLKKQYNDTKNKQIDTNYNSILDYFTNYERPK